MALTEWSAFIAAAPDKGLQAPPVLLAVKGVGTNNIYLLEADASTGGLILSFSLPTTPVISNISIPLANTEVAIPLPSGCRKFAIRLRGNAELKFSFVLGSSGTTYMTIPRGNVYTEDNISISGITLYVQSPTASQTAELITWT